MLRIIGISMCLASIIWGYYEHQAGTMLFGPLIGFLTGASIIISTFDATETLLRKLVSKSTSEEERSASDKHNRQAMLNRVRDFWVKGVLERSLHEEARIELGLEERRDAVAERPWDVILRTPDRPDCTLPSGTKISDVFERVGRSLLILGEPGAGKTTTLLELAKEMINRAEKDFTEKEPVVFNLSSWTDPKQPIADWLAEELRAKYNFPKKIAALSVEKDSLLFLLDGLDEVADDRKEACVDAINSYLDEHSAMAAVCCRKEVYEAHDVKLKLQSAVLLQPLTPQQIDGYLQRLSPDLDSLREALRSDRGLQEFAKTPLILSIMTLAYRGISVESLPSLGSTEERRGHLFETYVDRMFERTTRIDPKLFPKEKTIHWLSWLARKMSESNQTIFLIERMQPSWLETKAQRRLYFILVGLIYGLSIGLIGGLIFGLKKSVELLVGSMFDEPIGGPIGLSEWLTNGLDICLIFWLIFWLILNVVGEIDINPTEVLNFSSWKVRIFEPIAALRECLISGLISGLSVGLIGGLIFELIGERLRVGLIDGLIIGLIGGLFFGLFFGLKMGIGLIFWLIFGGLVVIQHFALRFVLHRKGLLPWKLVPFLDYSSERIFLRKVGGGYVFVHRMLMDYFASLEPGPSGR